MALSAEALGRALIELWEDQEAFNRQLRTPPVTDDEMVDQVRDFVLYTESELHELLRTLSWKKHRRQMPFENRGHMQDETADILKCVVSLFQILGETPESLIDAYWAKTAVVRQRYQEEWQTTFSNNCAVIDIDQVLCDYITGMTEWLARRSTTTGIPLRTLQRVANERLMVNAANLEIRDEDWKKLKHQFRVSGAKRALPAFADARPFLHAIRQRGLQIVLLTSRPIDRYPNLYTDTLLWLQRCELPFDCIWWAQDKAERLLESGLREHVRFFVDDVDHYVAQFAALGIPSYHLLRGYSHATVPTLPNVHPVTCLKEVVDHYDHTIRETETWPTTPMLSIDPTQPTSESITPRPSHEDPNPSL